MVAARTAFRALEIVQSLLRHTLQKRPLCIEIQRENKKLKIKNVYRWTLYSLAVEPFVDRVRRARPAVSFFFNVHV